MKLCISYAWEDEPAAREVGSICDRLGIEPVFDGRGDWLQDGLHPPAGTAGLHLLIVTRTNRASWWLPFQLGRAVEREIPVCVYLPVPLDHRPGFLDAETCVVGAPALEERLSAGLAADVGYFQAEK